MLKSIGSVLLALSISSCMLLDLLPTGGGVNTELIVGDKRQEVNTEIGGQKANTIINEDSAPIGLMILAALGWFMPSPQELFRMWRTRNG